MDNSLAWGKALNLNHGKGHGWQPDNNRLSNHLRPSLDMITDIPDEMLRKHGMLPTAAPRTATGALEHVYLRDDLAATYAERQHRWRMISMFAWMGFQFFFVATTLTSAHDVAVKYKAMTHTMLRLIVWVTPCAVTPVALLALYALFKSNLNFRGALLTATVFGLLATTLQVVASFVPSGSDATLALLFSAQITNAAAVAIWAASFPMLCTSRFNSTGSERTVAFAAVIGGAWCGVAVSAILLPSVLHGSADLSRTLLAELVCAALGLVMVFFGFPPAVAIWDHSSNLSTVEPCRELLHSLSSSGGKPRLRLCAVVFMTCTICWVGTVGSSVVRQAAGADAWGGGDHRYLSSARALAGAVSAGLFGAVALLHAKCGLCSESSNRPSACSLLTVASGVYAVAMLWFMLALPTPFSQSALVSSMQSKGSLLPAAIASGGAESICLLLLYEILSNLVPPMSMGLAGCGLSCCVSVIAAVGAGSVKHMSAEVTTLSSAIGALLVFAVALVCAISTHQGDDAEGTNRQQLNGNSWMQHNSIFDHRDPVDTYNSRQSSGPKHAVFCGEIS